MRKKRETPATRELQRLRDVVEAQAARIATLERATAPQVRVDREILGTLQRAPDAFQRRRGSGN